ncbi:MAG TPA: DNA-formamidopyrimidine glycosylase family protein, partial [Chitinophagaceae bacterium]|nr:DNA-formamidopyrimidine glycosylase family protein [Chitinophagaceae bacterium]
VFSRNLTKLFGGKTVRKVTISKPSKLKITAQQLTKNIRNQKLKKIYREGKELRFEFANSNLLGIHLMLHGKLVAAKPGEDLPKYMILSIEFDDGESLSLTDYQKAANASLNPEESLVPDALDLTFGYMKNALQKKSNIKTVLMDQKVIRGIGNAYADEILWDARIAPFSISKALDERTLKRLLQSIRKVLKNGEKQIIKKDPNIIQGEVRDFLKIHNSKMEKSPSGTPILITTIGGRKTYYTKEQIVYE